MKVKTNFGEIDVSEDFVATVKFLASILPPDFSEQTEYTRKGETEEIQLLSHLSDEKTILFSVYETSEDPGIIGVLIIWLMSNTRVCHFNFNKDIDFELVKKTLQGMVEVYNYPLAG